MQIIMIEQYSGSRYDGRMWPSAGEPFEVPDDEGKALIAHGVAKPVPAKPAAAKTTPAKADPPPADPAAAPAKGKAQPVKDQTGG